MRVVSLHIYPVKSCYRVAVDTATVEPWGLAGDRRWMVVEPEGRFLTQRIEPAFTRIHPTLTPDGVLLRAAGRPDLPVAAPADGDRVVVPIWQDRVKAVRAGDTADAWMSAALGRACWLVYLDDPEVRRVDPTYGREDDRVSFADAYPLLLANSASLEALNGWLDEPVPMTRFRPNVVIDGAPAWAEDDWIGRRLRIGAVEFRAPKPCDRCVTTTTDQETGERGREPLKTLGRMRRFPAGLLFATNLIPDGVGEIAVGDPVELLED